MIDPSLEEQALMVWVTVPSANADALARHCVASGLAACVNLLPPMSSVYRWQGAVETAREQLLVIKTTRAAYPKLEASIHAVHPYELPEIISVSLGPSSTRYLQWLYASVSP